MIENLKTIVTLHRSLLAVSLTAAVIGFTAEGAGPELELAKRCENLRDFPFINYQRFARGEAETAAPALRAAKFDRFVAELTEEGVSFAPEDRADPRSTLFPLLGVARPSFENSELANPGELSPEALEDAVDREARRGDLSLVFPDPVTLARNFFDTLDIDQPGVRISSISSARIVGGGPSDGPISFLGEKEINVFYEFGVRYDEGGEITPSKPFKIDTTTVQKRVRDTSVQAWLAGEENLDLDADTLTFRGGDAVVLSAQRDLPAVEDRIVDRSARLRDLPKSLRDRAESRLATSDGIKVLGIEVAGPLPFLAFPIAITGLIYYSWMHLILLARQATEVENFEDLSETTAWLPVMSRLGERESPAVEAVLNGKLKVYGPYGWWTLEAVGGFLLVPVGAVGALLYAMVFRFPGAPFFSVSMTAAVVVLLLLSAWCGYKCVVNVARVRRQVYGRGGGGEKDSAPRLSTTAASVDKPPGPILALPPADPAGETEAGESAE